MIPLLLKIKIPNKNGNFINLYLPLFIAWLILFPLLILLSPVVLLLAALTWYRSHGRTILFLYPMFVSLLWHLKGLKIDIQNKGNQIYLSFI